MRQSGGRHQTSNSTPPQFRCLMTKWSSQPSAEEGEIMAQKKFLVTGATGDTGGYTVEQLLERGHAVRALAHREDDRSKRLGKMGAEVVIGDVPKFNDVRAAMRGVRGAYFCYPIRPGILQATAYFAQAAKEAGLECVVNMSQKSAREDALSHAAQDHWLSEQVFDWSGITVTHLRPTYFAEWLLILAPSVLKKSTRARNSSSQTALAIRSPS